MSAAVCTCIRHERDARQIAVPDPTCPHGTVDADRAAIRTSRVLGRAITILAALTIALAPAALWPGTWWAALGLTIGATLIARLAYVAITSKERP